MTPRIYIGTIGEGVFRSLNGGHTFARAMDGMFVECHVRALAIHPEHPRTLFLGSEQGLFRSDNGADSWQRVDSPLNGRQIWSILIAPQNPKLIMVSTCPSAIFRSEDGGATWTEGKASIREDCPRIMRTRVTTLKADPWSEGTLWAGVEIDGLFRSTDAGRSWEPFGSGLSSRDIHDIAFAVTHQGQKVMLAATNNDSNRSTDGGVTWQPLEIGKQLPWSYCRSLATLAPLALRGRGVGGEGIVFLGNGDGPPGTVGIIARSEDGGVTWRETKMPRRGNGTIWNFAMHPSDSEFVLSSSVNGLVFQSRDAGLTWEMLPREFGEIRALAWGP
ncbi:MAG: hypothetical protein HY040_00115 [Planctomycetes bacterium]|nr:hypothetical protein [Planctomycetota bacterium]